MAGHLRTEEAEQKYTGKESSMNWDNYFTKILEAVTAKSQDRSSRYGAVIVREERQSVISTGYNGIPRGVMYKEKYHERPDKYMYWVHAEQNAIFNAGAEGISLIGTMMYVLNPPCAECMKAIIQSGIKKVIFVEPLRHDPTTDGDIANWRMTLEAAEEMAGEAGVMLRQVRTRG